MYSVCVAVPEHLGEPFVQDGSDHLISTVHTSTKQHMAPVKLQGCHHCANHPTTQPVAYAQGHERSMSSACAAPQQGSAAIDAHERRTSRRSVSNALGLAKLRIACLATSAASPCCRGADCCKAHRGRPTQPQNASCIRCCIAGIRLWKGFLLRASG